MYICVYVYIYVYVCFFIVIDSVMLAAGHRVTVAVLMHL